MSLHKCSSCEKDTFLDLYSKACDGNYYTLRKGNGVAEKQGYMPTFTGLTDSEGCSLSICLDCGTVQGLDLKKLRKQVKETFKDDIMSTKNKNNSEQDGGDEESDGDEESNDEDGSGDEEMTRVTKKKKNVPEKPVKKSGSKTVRPNSTTKTTRKPHGAKPPKTSGSKTNKKTLSSKTNKKTLGSKTNKKTLGKKTLGSKTNKKPSGGKTNKKPSGSKTTKKNSAGKSAKNNKSPKSKR